MKKSRLEMVMSLSKKIKTKPDFHNVTQLSLVKDKKILRLNKKEVKDLYKLIEYARKSF